MSKTITLSAPRTSTSLPTDQAPRASSRPRGGITARRPPRSIWIAALGALVAMAALLAAPSNAQAQGSGFTGYGNGGIVLAGLAVATAVPVVITVYDVGLIANLASPGRVALGWSVPNLVLSSIESITAIGMIGAFVPSAGDGGGQAAIIASSILLAHGLGSLALSIYGLSRPLPRAGAIESMAVRSASLVPRTPTLTGVFPLLLATHQGSAPGIGLSFRW